MKFYKHLVLWGESSSDLLGLHELADFLEADHDLSTDPSILKFGLFSFAHF